MYRFRPFHLIALVLAIATTTGSAYAVKTKADPKLSFYPRIYLDDRLAETGKVVVYANGVEIAKQAVERGMVKLSLPLYKDFILKFKIKSREFSIELLGSTLPTPDKVFDYIIPFDQDIKVYSNTYIKKKGAYKNDYFDPRNYEIKMKIIRYNKKRWEEDEDYAKLWHSGTLLNDLRISEDTLRARLGRMQVKMQELADWQNARIELGNTYASMKKISGSIYYGEYLESPLSSANVELHDEYGALLEVVKTTELGSFVFSKVQEGKRFSIELANGQSAPANTRIAITDENREIVKETVTNDEGGFDFSFLPSDKHSLELMSIEDTEMVMDFDGKIFEGEAATAKPVKNLNIELTDKAGTVVSTSKTEENGSFHFANLPAEGDYSIHVNSAEAAKITSGKITVTTTKGDLISTLDKSADGSFGYELLPADKFELGTLHAEDPWINVLAFDDMGDNEVTVREQIHFATGKAEIAPEDLIVLNKVVRVLVSNPKLKVDLSTHSDARGSDEANLLLSQERAAAAMAIIVDKGINPIRIKAIGKGETELLNDCGNDATCTEKEHAVNRRAEFKVYQ